MTERLRPAPAGPPPAGAPWIGVVICSAGRPDWLAEVLPCLARQTYPPSQILLSVTGPRDVPTALAPMGPPMRFQTRPQARSATGSTAPAPDIVFGPKGLPKQRNRALQVLDPRCDVVFFMDDDYFPAADALAGIARTFAAMPEVSGLTGRLLADGIGVGGLTAEAARGLLDRDAAVGRPRPLGTADRRRLVGLYGCNMAFRRGRLEGLGFDERLPLYGWQEDVDFAARVPGEKIATGALVGVHCGAVSGRGRSGCPLGYSQIANPVHLIRKGSIPPAFGLRLMLRNLVANHLRSLRPESWIDRRGRARGNRLALRDLLRGGLRPERILELGGR